MKGKLSYSKIQGISDINMEPLKAIDKILIFQDSFNI